MDTINRCLEITEYKRAALEAFDRRHAERKEMIAMRRERREMFGEGNRKQRRRQAALARQGREIA